MWKTIAKGIGLLSLIAITMQFSSCTSYYLQKVNTSFCVPNGSPNAVVKRDAGDTRLSMGLGVNPISELKFNDGNHRDTQSLYREKYSGKNIEINYPSIQGSLLLDYSILKHLFIFGKGNFGYAEDVYCGAINAGVGAHFRVLRMAISGYLMPGFFTLNSDAQILRTELFDSSSYFNSQEKTFEFSMGGGLKFITADSTKKVHLSWGLDAQIQKYFAFIYEDSTFADDDETNSYWMFFITPTIGVQGTFGNSEVDLALHFDVPAIAGGGDYNDELLNEGIIPRLTVAYSYCFKRKNRN